MNDSNNYIHLGDFNAAGEGYGIVLQCDLCCVKWVGCWDNAACPKCGNHDDWDEHMEARGYYKPKDTVLL